jgi:hypothetical protein
VVSGVPDTVRYLASFLHHGRFFAMRFKPGAAVTVALMTLLLAACGGGAAATSTPAPAPTAAAGSSAAADASSCPAPAPSGQASAPTAARASGTISAIAGTTFTLTQPDKSTQLVMTTPNTIYNKESTSSVGAIGVGDLLMVAGSTSGDSVAATMIFDNGTQMMQRQRAALAAGCPFVPAGGNFTIGTVTKANGAMLTMATAGGKTTTVTTDSATKVTLRQMATFADLKMGDQAMAMAGGNASATATSGFVAAVVNDQGVAQ